MLISHGIEPRLSLLENNMHPTTLRCTGQDSSCKIRQDCRYNVIGLLIQRLRIYAQAFTIT